MWFVFSEAVIGVFFWDYATSCRFWVDWFTMLWLPVTAACVIFPVVGRPVVWMCPLCCTCIRCFLL